MLPKALKSCPKSNKSPNLVTLLMQQQRKERNKKAFEKVQIEKKGLNFQWMEVGRRTSSC